ncbi:unnamed protein product [Tilletia controversa]|uniref:XPG-I domain-containing protein n=1 Tax=Tilletia controversa TaxID=13291 RepID=A0A8X7MWE4_9BASI|nr:hypothetical protein CF328_g2027 [Tilletia controversa]KAE8251827.1 hypothetical protein A4X06_0g2515 [Tilletia controversa]CAD6936850.1 unnamed protein product [Tilletia controversa]CAD6951052.1 unnamed protein product [Tilletia controversa]CAD6952482.1 unnamed protein product [Tilletia controversa]
MGVKLLWPELDAAAQETTLEILALSAFLHDGEVAAGTATDAADGAPQTRPGQPSSSRTAEAETVPAKRCGPVRRHLVLGVDASIWLYHAMTMKHTGGHKAEVRMLFFRLAKLHALPIIPIFVFDGPGRPVWKRNKQRPGAYTNAQYSFPHQSDFEKLIRLFGFAVYHAPAEAEAQLASMNADGVVDAVLTDDGDAFLFGAQIVLRNSSKTLSGSQARANRLQRGGGEDDLDSDSGDPDSLSQSSASSSRSRQPGSRRTGTRKGKRSAHGNGDREDASDAGSDSRYTPSAESEGSEHAESSPPVKSKATDAPKKTEGLQGKVEDSYTAYRSFLVFDGPRSQADERLFPSRKVRTASMLDMLKSEATPNKILDRDGLILSALLSGGDYDVQGLARCGMKTAIALARCGYGKRLINAFKKHFDSPAYIPAVDRPTRPGGPSSRQAWDHELSVWVRDVQQELRSNSQGFMERKASKLASAESWNQFLRTDQALDVVRSYIWPKVTRVSIHDAFNQVPPQKRPFRRRQDPPAASAGHSNGVNLSTFASSSTTSHHGAQLPFADLGSPVGPLEAKCDLSKLCNFAQILFNWDAPYALKRFSSLLWDGCVLRRAISMILYLDQEREAGRAHYRPIVSPKKASTSSPTKSKLTRRASDKSLGDITITPQARRFADFFEKSVQLKTPQRSNSAGGSLTSAAPDHQNSEAKSDSSDLRQGDIHILAVHSSRQHALYGGMASEIRISYATDGLRKAVQSGLVSEWARGSDGLFEPATNVTSDRRQNSDSNDVDSESDADGVAGSNVDDEERDELITLSQVARKKKAKNKVNDRRMWIPKVIIADLPSFCEPPKSGIELPRHPAGQHSPMELVQQFEDAQREKAETERMQAQRRASKTRAKQGKLAKPEVGQRSISDFFSVASKGKGKAREVPLAKLPTSHRQRPKSSDDGFGSSMSEDEDDGIRAVQKPSYTVDASSRPTTSKIHIPSRFKSLLAPASESDNSVIALSSPPRKTHVDRREIGADSAVQLNPRSTLLSQTTSLHSASDVDELIDEMPSQSSVAAPPKAALSDFLGGLVKKSAAEDDASEEEVEEEDDSLPDIFSQAYSQSRLQQRKNQNQVKAASQNGATAGPSSRSSTIPATRQASKSPDGSEDNMFDKTKLQRSPKKSPRKATTQLHAWSSGIPTSSSPLHGQSSTAKGKSQMLLSDDSEQDEDDDSLPNSMGARPASPSPLPKRLLSSVRNDAGTQDTSASFEIVGETRANGKPREVYYLSDSD